MEISIPTSVPFPSCSNKSVKFTETKRKAVRSKIRADRIKMQTTELESIKQLTSEYQQRLIDLNCEKGASLWLSTLPIKEEGYVIAKNLFWDLIRLRYGWNLKRMPTRCECSSNFNIEHALSCKKGGFVSLRHNHLRNITCNLLNQICNDVSVEPMPHELTGEEFTEKSSIKTSEARLDVKARGFLQAGQLAFFDIRVFNPMAKRYANQILKKSYETNEAEKKRKYNERVMQIEHGTFTPLIFSATGGMGQEASKVFRRVAEAIAEKKNTEYSTTISWVRRKLCFSLVQSLGTCIRGSRTRFSIPAAQCNPEHCNPASSEVIANILI